MTLRPYQLAAVDAVVDAWSAGCHAPVIALPTGAGKTVTAAHLLHGIRDDVGLRSAWLTDREILMEQTRGELESCGLFVALVQAPPWRTPPADVMAADVLLIMVQTLRSRGWMPDDLGVGCMVHDEAHIEHGIIKLWLETGIPACGLTATPVAKWMHQEIEGVAKRKTQPTGAAQADAGSTPAALASFGPWTGPLVAPLSTRSLIDSDVLLAPVFRVDIPDPSEHKDPLTGERYSRAGEDWSAEEAEQIMSPHTRAIAAKWRALCDASASDGGYDGAQPPTIVQAATIDHAGALADAFRRAARASGPKQGRAMMPETGLGPETSAGEDGRGSRERPASDGGADGSRIWRVLSARQSNDESRKIMADFRTGKIHGLVAVHKLAIGTDAPDATIAVSARPSRSIIVWIQYVGRLMRLPKSERGNRRVTVLDCAGNAHRHAGRLHRFWSDGPKWPFPPPRPVGGGSGPPQELPLPLPCDDHPTVMHLAGAQVCSVCFKPLREPEPIEEAKTFRADQVSLRDLATTVLRLAQDRACRPPLDGGESARKWAWMQVRTLTGRKPRDGWPSADWRERDYADPHPVVRRTVKRNGGAYREWMELPEHERPEQPEQEQVAWTS